MTAIAFLVTKTLFGEPTPDEIFYTSQKSELDRLGFDFEEMSIKFFVTYYVIRFLYEVNPFLFQIVNISLSVLVFRRLYSTFMVKGYSISKFSILVLFLLPSFLYFASAYLRDIYIYLISLLILDNLVAKNCKVNKSLLLLICFLFLLRPEAAFLFIVAFSVNYYRIRYNHRINRKVIIGALFSVFLVVFFSLLLSFDFFWQELTNLLARYEDSVVGFTVYQLEITKLNFIPFSFLNWAAYFSPLLFVPRFTLFGLITYLDSFVIAVVVLKFFFQNIHKPRNYYDRTFAICSTLVLLTFFISIPEKLPETIYRHHLFYIPMLFYVGLYRDTYAKESYVYGNGKT
ncbi:hypothetical protein QWY31_03895 [Cytophagales bacterium LB-30]|uniref:Glycosyltransferase RgtA/B/C/D-like domain-containing protein n=1 Tax=Shiella aurantiaca TaxID=3058365 RepID=A0ABT8F2Q1_9BACT|nr:hypothetical protein [Shiella aurantiaca]MDN4164629.1 hypothetical protein [Shiella aurantiaca]